MSIKLKKLFLIVANLIAIAVILYHSCYKYLAGDSPKKSFLIPLFLLSTLFFTNTIFYIQQYLFENSILVRFQKKLLMVLLILCITMLILFYKI
jgi:hypothetical protein